MSIFRVIKREDDGIEALQDRLTYIIRASATFIEYIYPVGVSEWDAYRQMRLTKNAYGQEYGKAFYHYMLRPDSSDYDVINANGLFDIGRRVANLIAVFYGYYQVVSAEHFDTPPHLHFIANNIDYMTGERFDLSPMRLYELKQEINKILIETGVTPVRLDIYDENDGE